MADDPFHHKMVDVKGEDGSQRRQWEQQEEEDNAEKQVSRMKLFGSDAKALYDLDQENAARVYTVPSPLANA